jgi:dTMP kinase
VTAGKLVVFEGVDGCGKSTQIARLAEHLRTGGHTLRVTREPTEGPAGQRIRAMARSGEAVSAEQELAWFVEDRHAHVDGVVQPALDAGEIVVCDRYTLSTVAYQGARGLDAAALLVESEATFPIPDLALLLEIDPERALARVRARGGASEPVFEHLDRLERVAAIYRALDRPYIERVDADRPETEIASEIAAIVRRRLGGDVG